LPLPFERDLGGITSSDFATLVSVFPLAVRKRSYDSIYCEDCYVLRASADLARRHSPTFLFLIESRRSYLPLHGGTGLSSDFFFFI